MKPRVFVSSTFYDLKYIREDLANFIRAHDFEPIMFEDGDIGYTPGIPLDDSCYEAMRNADMALLIIGGQYGSAATGEDNKNKEFISVTRREYETAVGKSVPIFCFVDKSVLSEYEVYKLNKERVQRNPSLIKFRVTKSINVFRFIDDVYRIGKISIIGFEKSDEIKEYLGKQWADMFKKYLELLKTTQESNKLNQAVNEMNIILKQMKNMVNKIGKETIKDTKEYEDLLIEQQILDVQRVAEIMSEEIHIQVSNSEMIHKESIVKKLVDVIEKLVVENVKENFTGMLRKANIGDEYFYSLVEIYGDTVKRCLKNKRAKDKLIQVLQQDCYFNKIFTDDITKIEKDLNWLFNESLKEDK